MVDKGSWDECPFPDVPIQLTGYHCHSGEAARGPPGPLKGIATAGSCERRSRPSSAQVTQGNFSTLLTGFPLGTGQGWPWSPGLYEQGSLPAERFAGPGSGQGHVRVCTGWWVPRAPALGMVLMQETRSISVSARAGGSFHRRDHPCRDSGTVAPLGSSSHHGGGRVTARSS